MLQTCIWTMGDDGVGGDFFPESCGQQVAHSGVGEYVVTENLNTGPGRRGDGTRPARRRVPHESGSWDPGDLRPWTPVRGRHGVVVEARSRGPVAGDRGLRRLGHRGLDGGPPRLDRRGCPRPGRSSPDPHRPHGRRLSPSHARRRAGPRGVASGHGADVGPQPLLWPGAAAQRLRAGPHWARGPSIPFGKWRNGPSVAAVVRPSVTRGDHAQAPGADDRSPDGRRVRGWRADRGRASGAPLDDVQRPRRAIPRRPGHRLGKVRVGCGLCGVRRHGSGQRVPGRDRRRYGTGADRDRGRVGGGRVPAARLQLPARRGPVHRRILSLAGR
jgi:hypothetical protein